MLLDRFGARPVTAGLFALAGASALLFAASSDFATLLVARALIGVGISAAFMGALKAMVEQMPREKIPMSNSMIMASGGVGLMSATYPVQIALNYTDWRGVFVGIAIATFALTAAIVWVAPKTRPSKPSGRRESFKGVIQVFTNREFLRFVPLGSAAQGVNMAMSGLWAGPWLRDVVGLTREQTATVLFGMATSISLSVLVIGWIATRLARRGFPIIATACCGMAGFILFESLIIANVAVNPFLLWIPYAACATAPTLIYAVLANSFTPDMAGRVNTAYNFTTFTFAFAVQWFLGAVIDLWPPLGEGRFAPEGYRWGFAIVVAIQLCAFMWLVLAPKVYARR
jgi:MFS family permease